ncbi:glycosyltransferase domain-containing protein [Pelotalea chapellei]|uniref:DUF616 domain-containing protein n=1 Tax=Pelotalea chapellei TaxID=44671 RepID=A0ABS5U5N0_9BACT|nr:glycosyltransferase domain-containing protein [Pelotalea chapellei]MBT1070967.1 DUF616 domain-containing protein [Pelotalea chapellei]
MDTNKPTADAMVPSTLKIAVYTCITQGYDSLKVPFSVDKRISYFCFTDSPQSVLPPWQFIPIALKELSPKDQNRYIKMHPHHFLQGYDVTVYIDGNIQVVGDLFQLVCKSIHSSGDIFVYQHPNRNCIYAEGAACSHIAHERIWNIAKQMRRYHKKGYPINNGLFEANVIIRKNTDRMRHFMNEWWNEYCLGAKRDQLSLPFVAWLLQITVESLGESDPRFKNNVFRRFTHPSSLRPKLIMLKVINRSIAFVISYEKLFGLDTKLKWNNEIKKSDSTSNLECR